MKRSLSVELVSSKDEQVCVQGWVNSRRDHGGLVFIDIRDHSGVIQVVVQPENEQAFKVADSLRDEFAVEVQGTITEREDGLKNDNIETGAIELVAESIRVLNKSLPLPFQIESDQNIHEETRLKYRYLDLRRSKMQTTLKQRSKYYSFVRRYMEDADFTEVSTPILANSSPEGARDFVVPSRFYPGQFYALPQAPQQFKQLLMVGGIPRYYQIATCFRDEDPRADRLYGDFYQLDLEMSFVEDGEVVRSTMEPLITSLVNDFAGKELMFDEVPRITYEEAMNRFGSDKPDMRFDMELNDVSDIVKSSEFGVFKNTIEAGGAVKAIVVPKLFSRKQIDELTEKAKSTGAGGLPYMTFQDGELQSSITKFFSDSEKQALTATLGLKDGDTILYGVGPNAAVNKTLGTLRSHLGTELELKDPNKVALLWVIDFPLYETDEKTGELDFAHNPFSMPKGGTDGFNVVDKTTIVADQYDMVMNGYEICSGAVRNHNPDIMYEVFGALNYSKEHVEENFGGMLNAFKYGAPPHAGCAFGLDRIFMVLTGEENIREVVAFPKNGSGVDLMMQSPSTVDSNQLKELNIAVKKTD